MQIIFNDLHVHVYQCSLQRLATKIRVHKNFSSEIFYQRLCLPSFYMYMYLSSSLPSFSLCMSVHCSLSLSLCVCVYVSHSLFHTDVLLQKRRHLEWIRSDICVGSETWLQALSKENQLQLCTHIIKIFSTTVSRVHVQTMYFCKCSTAHITLQNSFLHRVLLLYVCLITDRTQNKKQP